MPNNAKRRKLRLARKRQRTEAAIGALVRGSLPKPPTVDDAAGLLKAVRALGALGLSSRKQQKLRAALTSALAELFKTESFAGRNIRTTSFGLKDGDFDGLARLFVRMLERMRYGEYGISELRRKRAGLHGVFAGEIFELLVLHHEGIQKQLHKLAEDQKDSLNQLMRRGKARLIDGNGAPFAETGEWRGVQRVTDILVHRGNQRLKFTDFAYVSYLAPRGGGPRVVSFLVETEVKLPRAAAGFAEQMGVKQARFAGADKVEFTLADGSTQAFTPGEIVFDRGNINRVALTTTKGPRETWRLRSTKLGGYAEVYFRIALVVDVEQLRAMVNLAFRR